MSFYDTSDAIFGTGTYGSASYGIVTPTVALTGVSGTGAVEPVAAGGFEVDISERLSGVSATGSIGVISPNLDVSATGVSATGSVGTVEARPSEPVDSVSATGSIGTIAVNLSLTLTGVAGTGAINDDLDIRSIKTANATGVVGTTAVNGNVNIVVVIDQVTGVGATASLGSIDTKVKEPLNSVAGTSALGTITTTAVVTVFAASAYDRKHVVNVVPEALQLRSVPTGAASDFSRQRVVTVQPQQTSIQRRAA